MKPWRAAKASTRKTVKKSWFKATSLKYYWLLLKAMLNSKKIPYILPIIHDKKFVIDFNKKVDLFFFVCFFLLQNSAQLLKITNNFIN